MALFKREFNYHLGKDRIVRPCSAKSPERCPYKDSFHFTYHSNYSQSKINSSRGEVHRAAVDAYNEGIKRQSELLRSQLDRLLNSEEHVLAEGITTRSIVKQIKDKEASLGRIPQAVEIGKYIRGEDKMLSPVVVERNICIVDGEPGAKLYLEEVGKDLPGVLKVINTNQQPRIAPCWMISSPYMKQKASFSIDLKSGEPTGNWDKQLSEFLSDRHDREEMRKNILSTIVAVEGAARGRSDYRPMITNKTTPPYWPTLKGREAPWDNRNPIIAPLEYDDSYFTSKDFEDLLKSGDFDEVVPNPEIVVEKKQPGSIVAEWQLKRDPDEVTTPWSFTVRKGSEEIKNPVSPVIYGSLEDFGFSPDEATEVGNYALELSNGSEAAIKEHREKVIKNRESTAHDKMVDENYDKGKNPYLGLI